MTCVVTSYIPKAKWGEYQGNSRCADRSTLYIKPIIFAFGQTTGIRQTTYGIQYGSLDPDPEFFSGTMRLKGATVWEVDLLPVD